IFSTPDVIDRTKMDVSNLSMIFAPSFLRCPTDSLETIFKNSKYEQFVVKNLLTNFRPSYIDDDVEFGFDFEDL
ncbi:7378_t:CDS:1, partial [Acaulospora morrowiae]